MGHDEGSCQLYALVEGTDTLDRMNQRYRVPLLDYSSVGQ